jgi:plasmid maintenance system antidote protein VapI
MSEAFWLNLQAHYDLEVEKDRLGDSLEKEVAVYAAPK